MNKRQYKKNGLKKANGILKYVGEMALTIKDEEAEFAAVAIRYSLIAHLEESYPDVNYAFNEDHIRAVALGVFDILETLWYSGNYRRAREFYDAVNNMLEKYGREVVRI